MLRIVPCLVVVVALAMNSSLSAQVVEEHIRAVGGSDAIAKIKTINRSGTVSIEIGSGKSEGTIVEAYDMPKSQGYQKLDAPGFRQETSFNGNSGWKKTVQDGVKELNKDELGLAKLSLGVSPIATIYSQFGKAAFVDAGEKDYRGKRCDVVNVVGNPLVFYINKKTKLMDGIEIPGLFGMTLSNYKEIDGVKMPVDSKMELSFADMTITTKLDKVQVNRTFDDSKLERPTD